MWRERFVVVGAVVAALVLGGAAHELWWSPPAPGPAGAEVLAAVLDADGPRGGPADLQHLEALAADAVLAVEVRACGSRRRASATLVRHLGGAPRVVTNVHVVNGAGTVHLADGRHGGGLGAATVSGRWSGRDLAELDAGPDAALGHRALPLGPDPVVGDRVLVVGHPGGRPSARTGVVRSVELRHTDGATSPALVVDVPASGGHSGGAVVDVDGRVVGIVAARDPDTGHTVAHPASVLAAAPTAAVPGC